MNLQDAEQNLREAREALGALGELTFRFASGIDRREIWNDALWLQFIVERSAHRARGYHRRASPPLAKPMNPAGYWLGNWFVKSKRQHDKQ
jgi:hypothetical protein